MTVAIGYGTVVTREGVIERLASSRVFAGLPPAKLRKIFAKGRVEELAEGDLLIEELEPNSDLCVVIDGALEVFLPLTAERFTKVSVANIGPGECIGEYSFIDAQPASASIAARSPAEVFKIAHGDFEELLQSDSAIGRMVYENLLRLLIARLRQELQSLDLFRTFG